MMFKIQSLLRMAVCSPLLILAGFVVLGDSMAHAQTPAGETGVAASPATAPSVKSMMDYFLPTPIVGKLDPDAWGAPNVLPRDRSNGLEDPTMMKNYCYWDGQIIKAKDGKYHMFSSRWDQAKGHNGWFGSVAVHSVSDSLFGPYVDQGMLWPEDQGGKGHNVTALTLPNDEGYAVIVSETRPGTVYTSKSLDGPWVQKGLLSVPDNPRWRASNVAIIVRPDGDFEMIQRSGQLMISKAADGILGPYKAQGPSVYPKGIPNLEDPVLFYSGGLYHITVNSWSTRTAYLLTSPDGINNWTKRCIAYQPDQPFVRYTDGTVNKWKMMERPGVYIENNEVKAFTFAVIDVTKQEERPNDLHGSKVIVVPFDGAAMDRDLQNAFSETQSTTSPK
jgi:hypothetical protein